MSKVIPNVTKKYLVEHFKIPIPTLKTILKNIDAVRAGNKEYGIHSKKRSRIQSGKFDQMKKALVQWIREARASIIPVNCQ